MKTLPILLSVLLACSSLSGCITLSGTTAQSAQSATISVVAAEKTLRVAKDTIDLFLHLEYDIQALVKEKFPEVHSFAEKLRRTAPDLLISANNIKNAYKHNRTPENAASLQTILATLQETATQAQQFTNK